MEKNKINAAEMADTVQLLVEKIQQDINDNLERPDILIMYAGVLMNMSREIMCQINGPAQTLKFLDFYRDLVEQEKTNTTIH